MYGRSFVVVLCLNSTSEIIHILYGFGLEQSFIVEMVKKYIQSFLGVNDMILVRCRCFGFDALHVLVEDLVGRLSSRWDVVTVTRSYK